MSTNIKQAAAILHVPYTSGLANLSPAQAMTSLNLHYKSYQVDLQWHKPQTVLAWNVASNKITTNWTQVAAGLC